MKKTKKIVVSVRLSDIVFLIIFITGIIGLIISRNNLVWAFLELCILAMIFAELRFK